MEEKIVMLNDDQLSEVTGGSHLSSGEVKDLKPGQILIIENDVGENIAQCTYLGQYRDPGFGHMLQCLVEVNYLYTYHICHYIINNEADIVPGQTAWVSRYFLDFPERA